MKNSVIIILVVALLVIAWVVYFYRDELKGPYENATQDASQRIENVQDATTDAANNVQAEVSVWVDNVEEAIQN